MRSNHEARSSDPQARFRTWAAVASAFVATLVTCALASAWSSFITLFIAFGVALFLTIHFGCILFERLHWLLLLPVAITIIYLVHQQFVQTTARTREVRVGAVAQDGFVSTATGSGAASSHGGVQQWLTIPQPYTLTSPERWSATLAGYWYLVPILAAIPAILLDRLLYPTPPKLPE